MAPSQSMTRSSLAYSPSPASSSPSSPSTTAPLPSTSLQIHSQTPSIHAALAGAAAGLVSRFTIAPLDVLKIRLQLSPHSTSSSSLVSTLNTLLRTEGFTALWKGNIPAEALYLLYGAVQFTSYTTLLHVLPRNLPFSSSSTSNSKTALSPLHPLLAGSLSSILATTTTYPLDLLRTRFAASGTSPVYPSLLSSVRTIHSTEGPSGFFLGLPAALLQVAPYMGLFFGLYEGLRTPLNRLASRSGDQGLWGWAGGPDALAGTLASMSAKTAVFPLDLIRKRVQVSGPMEGKFIYGVDRADGVKEFRTTGVWSTGKRIVAREGARGLYRGLSIGLIKAAPASAVTMWTYERVLGGLKVVDGNKVDR
ncbi:MAG: mitochondrial thiamine pyrophosphate transporter [Vezdaea aestivalis]|nr:MAG: mitochondrial thiamine pyrophosphate transporter [Vezdaea aestivalis]